MKIYGRILMFYIFLGLNLQLCHASQNVRRVNKQNDFSQKEMNLLASQRLQRSTFLSYNSDVSYSDNGTTAGLSKKKKALIESIEQSKKIDNNTRQNSFEDEFAQNKRKEMLGEQFKQEEDSKRAALCREILTNSIFQLKGIKRSLARSESDSGIDKFNGHLFQIIIDQNENNNSSQHVSPLHTPKLTDDAQAFEDEDMM